MADPWKIVSEKPIPAGAEVKAMPTPQESADADIAALQREIKAAIDDTSMDPDARARRISILEGELVRAINRQGDIAQAAEPPNPFDFDFSKFKAQQKEAKPAYGMHPAQAILAGGAGAAAGASAGAVPVAKKAALESFRQAGEAFRGQAPLPTAATPPSYGGEKWVKSLTDVNLPGGQMGKADLDLAKGMQAAVGREGAPGFTGGKITEGGILVSPQTAAQLPGAAPAPTPQQPGALRRAAGAVLGNPIVSRGLGGLGMGAGGAEAVERAKEGDILGASLAGLSAAGSAASMFPPAAIPGAMVAGVSTGALTLADKIRNKLAAEAKNPPIPEPTAEEMSRAYRPARVYRPSIRRPQQSKAEAISGALLDSLDEQLKQFSSAPG